jgi:hypothetical protein
VWPCAMRGHTCDVNDIMPIVENCVTLYITDRNILMALTTMPCRVDDYLYRHALNTCIMSIGIAVALGYSDRQVVEIGLCALLENVGMLLVDKSVSLKGRTSTHEDLLELKKHPDLGARLLKKVVRLPETVPLVASQAHEREDGSGYPAGKRGHLIHPFAKIIQIADVFDTMCNPAGSESAFTANEAMHSILKMTRRGQLLKEYAIAFISYVGLFPVGSFVELSDHRIARVVHAHAREFFKPIVSIISNTQATLLPDTDILFSAVYNGDPQSRCRRYPRFAGCPVWFLILSRKIRGSIEMSIARISLSALYGMVFGKNHHPGYSHMFGLIDNEPDGINNIINR